MRLLFFIFVNEFVHCMSEAVDTLHCTFYVMVSEPKELKDIDLIDLNVHTLKSKSVEFNLNVVDRTQDKFISLWKKIDQHKFNEFELFECITKFKVFSENDFDCFFQITSTGGIVSKIGIYHFKKKEDKWVSNIEDMDKDSWLQDINNGEDGLKVFALPSCSKLVAHLIKNSSNKPKNIRNIKQNRKKESSAPSTNENDDSSQNNVIFSYSKKEITTPGSKTSSTTINLKPLLIIFLIVITILIIFIILRSKK